MIVRDSSMIGALLPERDDVRSKLREFSIEIPDKSKIIRRSLRKRLGQEDHADDGKGEIHLSVAVRDLINYSIIVC